RGLAGEVMHIGELLRENQVAVDVTGDGPQLNAQAETALILALKELTTNVQRHSRGQECTPNFYQDQHHIKLTVCDIGMIKSLEDGNGLRGIRERLHALSGELRIDLGERSCFTISLPPIALSHPDE